MNIDQVAQQVVYALNQSNFKWPGGEPVFSRVAVDPAPPGWFHADLVAPAALLQVGASKDDPEHPADLVDEVKLVLSLFASNATDQSGGASVVGGNRAGLATSVGRGLLEIEPLVKAQLFNMVGLRARPHTTGGELTAYAGKMAGVVAERALALVATRIPSFPNYTAIRQLAGVGGAGSVSLTWAPPPDRYDLVGFTWARGTASFPTDPTTGNFVPGVATSLVDAPGAGSWKYSLWWAFDSTADPFTEVSGSPPGTPKPNAWSSQQSSQAGLVYLPAANVGANV